MKITSLNRILFFLLLAFSVSITQDCHARSKHHKKKPAAASQQTIVVPAAAHPPLPATLDSQYNFHCQQPSDIYQHVPVLRQLASECSTVIEMGVRGAVSTWGILKGLSESPYKERYYLGIDLYPPPMETLRLAKELAEANGVAFEFWQANDLQIDIEPVDMLFIDTMHIYCQLTAELEKFSPKVRKYICMHDTSDPWGSMDEPYSGDYSEYPTHINRQKRGLWQAVVDFLATHPEWKLKERRLNNHGFTILVRHGA